MAIKKFKHKKTGEIITYENGVIKSGTFVLDIGCEPSKEFWEEIVVKPLMITSDGVNLYEGDTFFFIDIHWGVYKSLTNTYTACSTWTHHPIFSTQKAAENYVKMNKPCLSLNDVLNSFPQNMDKSLREDIKHDLIKLVKTKI